MNYNGLTVFFGIGIIYIYILRNCVKDSHGLSLTLLIFSGLLLRLFTSTDAFPHEWDERYHFLVAKSLGNDFLHPRLYPTILLENNYKNWCANFTWLHKPPFTLWCMALSFKLFGINEFAGRIPSLLISTSCIYLTYSIALKLLKDPKIALLAAFFHSINGLVIEMASGRAASEHIDTMFFFILEFSVWVSLVYAEKKKIYLIIVIGILAGLAVLTKWYVGLFIIALFWIINIDKISFWRINFLSLLILIISCCVFYPWQYYILANFPNEAIFEKEYNIRHIFEVIEGHAESWWYHIDKARIFFNELIYVAFLWFLYQWYKMPLQRYFLIVIFWITIPYTIFSLTATKMPGYILFTAPAFFIILSSFIFFCLKQSKYQYFFKFLSVIVIFLALRFGYERIKPFKDYSYLKIQKEQILSYKTKFDKEKVVIFNTKSNIETMFYTPFLAYEKIPSLAEIELAKRNDYQIGVVFENDLPDYILNDKTVIILR